MALLISGCILLCAIDLDLLGVDSNIHQVNDLKESQIYHVTLKVDLENQGQIHLCMTFLISGCKHDTDLISVSILKFFEVRDIK